MARKAVIGLSDWGRTRTELLALAHKLEAGEAVPEADYHLNFVNAAQLFQELTPTRLALLEALKEEGPQSIYALAKHLKRNYSNVHRDVRKLIEHELVAKDEGGRVWVPWDVVEIHLTLHAAA